MRVLDLFSGVGGFALGMERAGHEVVAFCEADKYCQRVLKKHWPDVLIHEDIRGLDARIYRGQIDIITGGFPCQPFSVAGKQQGENDNRYLWPEMLRIIQECQPTWVIGENVVGIINLALEQVCVDLENEDYEVRPLIIPACAVDAPHRRDRVWILAYSERNRSQGELRQNSRKKKKPLKALSALSRPHGKGWGKLPTPRISRSYDGIPHRSHRIKGLGNAVIPQIVEQIGRVL